MQTTKHEVKWVRLQRAAIFALGLLTGCGVEEQLITAAEEAAGITATDGGAPSGTTGSSTGSGQGSMPGGCPGGGQPQSRR